MCGPSLKELIVKNRSYRRFNQEETISEETLKALVELARLSGSAGNLQPLKYIISSNRDKNSQIFSRLGWAGYLKDWPGPDEGERPPAYIVLLGDTEISKSFGCDQGIAAQSILLGAVEMGLGGCVIATIKRDELKADLGINGSYEILVVIAIGEPKENVEIEAASADGDIKYWRDDQSVHHVPKRSIDNIIIESFG